MVSVRAAKSKGNQHEYSTQYSLRNVFPDIYRTAERGFQRQYDLRSDQEQVAIECKRLAGISWNQAQAYFVKLTMKARDMRKHYLIFKSNRQPCLVMHSKNSIICIERFEDVFKVQYDKHPSTRAT